MIRNIAGTVAQFTPSLVLDFSKGIMPAGLTFARAGTATRVNASGVLETLAANTPRIDYDPVTLVCKGLLIEEARTNILLNSASLSTQNVTATATAYTLSFYGTGSITRSGTSSGSLAGTGATNRVSVTFTPTAGTLTLTVAGTVTNAQLEVGTFATSYIPTTTAAVTRAADVCSMGVLSNWLNPAEGTLTAVGTSFASSGISTRYAMLRNPGTNDQITIANSGAGQTIAQTIVATVVRSAGITYTPNVERKIAIAYGSVDGMYINGTSYPIIDQATPGGLTTFWIGCSDAGNQFNGWINSVRYYPRRLPNAFLQSLTS